MAKAFNLTAQINLQGPNNLKPIVSKIKKEIGAIKTSINLDVKASSVKNISQITSRLNSLSKAAINANSNITNLNSSLSALSSSFTNISSATSATITSTNNASKSLNTTTKAVNQTRSAIEEFGKQSGLAIKRFAAFSSVTTIVFGLVNAFNTAFGEFLNFNQEIVRLSQVTGRSTTELKGVTDEITRLSTTLGVSSKDLLTVTTTLAQAGLSAEDTKIALEALAKSALAPSFENITDTTEGAIAALRQFGLQTSELDSALGSINSVAAQFAVEAGDIITAIQRTGGVFAASSRGVSEGTDALNEFIAVFTSIRATTRESAETIATGLRTIFTRIQRSQTIDLLKEYGVELRDLEGKFVGPYEATKRLSEGLSKIDPRSAEFARISEELGGFRQIGKVIPLIQQFGVAQQALNVAQKGSGSLAKDAATAQQSLVVQFNKTRESFLALVRDIGDSGSFKAFVGVTLTLTNGLINLAGALKPLLPLLLTFTAIKAGSGIRQFASGFNIGLGGGGAGGGGAGGAPTIAPTGGGRGGAGLSPQSAAISANTSVLGTTTQTLNNLNNSILALNQNIVNTNSLLLNRPRGFASGGVVPGTGNSDTVPAMLTPGEFVVRKKAVQAIGANNLHGMNRYALGGPVSKQGKDLIKLYPSLKNKITDDEKFNANIIANPVSVNSNSLVASMINNKRKNTSLSLNKAFEIAISKVYNMALDSKHNALLDYPTKPGDAKFLSEGQSNFSNTEKGNNPETLLAKLVGSGRYSPTKRNEVTSYYPENPSQMRSVVNKYVSGTGSTAKKYGDAKLYANGGSVEDTVPALLTPGEFVINKRAASTLGTRKLNRLNKADKIQGFNKGGIVGYANGGSVIDSAGGNLVAMSIITSILMPEIEKLTSSFGKLSNGAQVYGEALSGAISQATSLAMSSSIALRTVGASAKTTGMVTGGAAIAGAIGGGLTEGTAKAMEKALLKNVAIFGKFDKTLQDLSNAPTEELRIEAAKNLEKTFVTLNNTVRDSVDSINSLEVANKLGESLNNFTLSVITGITAFTALKSATEAMVASARLASSSAGLASMGGTMGARAAPVGVVTQLVGKFGQFIPYVGLAITAISAIVEGFKLFNTSLTKSNEQIQRLNKGLLDVTKNSTDYNLANERFVDKVLPKYAVVAEQIRTNPELLPKKLGGIYGTETPFNELNLLFRQALKTNLAGEGIRISPQESIMDVQKRLGPDLKIFDKTLKETIKSFTDEQFVIARTAAGVSEEEARSELKRKKSEGATESINRVVQEYVAAQNQQILAQRQLAAANDAVRLSLINLDNILVSFEASINTTLNETMNNFKDLDDRVSSIAGTAKPAGGEFLRRDIEKLNNIKGLTSAQLKEVTSTVAGVLNISTGDEQSRKIFGDIESQVGAFKTIQTELPVILRKVGELNLNSQNDLIDVFEKQLGPSFEKFGGSGVSKTIINELVANIQAELAKGQAITNYEELGRNSKALAELQKNGEVSVRVFTAALEASAKVLDEVAERNKQIIEINKSLQDSLIQNRNAQSQNALELKKIFDQEISFNELIQPFVSGIKQLTSGIVGGPEGTANIDAIISEIKARKDYEQTLREQINLNRGNADILKDLNNELTTELTAIDNLKAAIDSFASSTEKAKYALEKIAESRNLFKTQRQTLIDLVKRSKDPTQQAELARIFDAIRSVEQLRATPQQAEIALENQQLVSATRNAAQAEAFVQKATQQLVGVGSFAQLLTQMFLSQGGFNAGAETELQKANEERNKAVQYENEVRRKQIEILGDNTILFDQFNKSLKNILPGIITNLQSIEQAGISVTPTQTKKEIGLPPGSMQNIDRVLQATITKFIPAGTPGLPPFASFFNLDKYMEPILSKEERTGYKERLGTSENPMPVLLDLMTKLDKTATFENNLIEERSILGKLINSLRQQQQQQNKPTTGPRSSDGASIQNFNNSVNSLATVFNDTTPAMNDLSTSMTLFNNTASQLTAALDKFAVEFKDGMKGQISYTGDVGVSFNEELAVNTNDTNRNRQLVDSIGAKVASVVNEKIKNLLLG